ncbi:hypothetical protein [Streptosporangium sp. NPDC006007]|uniref:hypothetical protein n=1 Tax=Streptosporangium sp. NPDC006007 TaxID=3154575 RepID=UPI0033A1D22F
MLKSKTRCRVAVKSVAVGAVSGGLIFGAVPAVASLAAIPKPVTYTCNPVGSPAAGAVTGNSYKLQMDLTAPLSAVPNSPLVATWRIGQPAVPGPALTAPSAIAAGDRLVIDADVVITGTPLPSPTETRTVGATSTPGAVAAGTALPFPAVLITVTPTATGVIGIQPHDFTLVHSPAAGTATKADLYDCTAAPAEASTAALQVTVRPQGAGMGTGTPTNMGLPTGSSTPTATPEPTITLTRTETSKPVKDRQVEETPRGAASTGGGGEAGPDARMIVLGGSLLMALAGVGGLVLRRRSALRG